MKNLVGKYYIDHAKEALESTSSLSSRNIAIEEPMEIENGEWENSSVDIFNRNEFADNEDDEEREEEKNDTNDNYDDNE